jgi:hypothetical protein
MKLHKNMKQKKLRSRLVACARRLVPMQQCEGDTPSLECGSVALDVPVPTRRQRGR